jgi:hypothetical protein
MREETIVVATRATRRDRDPPNTPKSRVVRDHGTQVDRRWHISRATCHALVYIRTHLIAVSANRRTEVHEELSAWNPTRLEHVDRTLDDSAGSASPTRMQERDRA